MSRIPSPAQALLEGFTEPAILLGADYRILAANRAYRDHYGVESGWEGRTCHELSHASPVPCDQLGEACPLTAARESGEPRRALHIHHSPRGDEHVDVELRPIHDQSGRLLYLLELMRGPPGISVRARGDNLVGRSPGFLRMLELVRRVAPSQTTALLLGESGTGKELVARAIHDQSTRRNGAFVPVECSGLTETLFESELFGHEKGAFTGAHVRKDGLVEAARGGTLFLDEIGDIPPPLQVKLLRLIETGAYRRVGSVDPQQADFRLVCATHRDLRAMVESGLFRQDLYFRISAFPLRLPPLRERGEDLPLLIESLLERLPGGDRLHLSEAALACLRGYAFPGNVRELRNILERASLLADGDSLLPEHLPPECCGGDPASPYNGESKILPLEEVERRYLNKVVRRYRGDRRALAALLGVSQRTLFRKLRALKRE
jgi:transcriptional regulator with PAS, ATPase and Fis domain